MTTHRNWHRRWTVDLESSSATHESGLVVRFLYLRHFENGYLTDARHMSLFVQSESEWLKKTIECLRYDGEGMLSTIKYVTEDGVEWFATAKAENLERVRADLLASHGHHDAPQMLKRLCWEAGEAWVWAWNRKLRHEARGKSK